jgi:hypothetical protein
LAIIGRQGRYPQQMKVIWSQEQPSAAKGIYLQPWQSRVSTFSNMQAFATICSQG